VRLQVSEKDSVFLFQNKAAAQSAMSAKLFLANGIVFIRQPLYAPDLAAAEYFFLIL
jgi:transposase